MKFSVIIPVYKVEKYLDECVQSVLAQTYNDFEVILVDDGSPDNCPAMCDAYAASDSRVKVIHKPNGGLSDARNVGLDAAIGDFVVFLDSDDYWNATNALQKAFDFIVSNPETEVLMFQLLKLKRGRIFLPEGRYDSSIINNSSIHEAVEYLISINLFRASACSRFVRRSILIDNNIKFIKGLVSEDFEWSFQLFAHVQHLKAIPDSFYVNRMREGSISHTITDKNLNDILWIIEKWNKELPIVYLDKKLCEVQYHQLGFIYAMLISIVRFSSKPKEFLKKIRPFNFLLCYDINPKVRKVKRSIRIIGLYPTYLLLTLRSKVR